MLESGLTFCDSNPDVCVDVDENSSCWSNYWRENNPFIRGGIRIHNSQDYETAEFNSKCINETTIKTFGCEPFTSEYRDNFKLPFTGEISCPVEYSCYEGACVENEAVMDSGVGDLNEDFVIDSTDVSLLAQLNAQFNSAYNWRADVDYDGVVDIYDYYRLDQIVIGGSYFKYPIRDFTLNSSYTLYSSQEDIIGILTESTPGYKFAWLAEHELGGASRTQCVPPVIKINLKDVTRYTRMLGFSSYSNPLRYDEFKMIPDCDIWHQFEADNLIREYFIYWMFRKFSVPTFDVIAFGTVNFSVPDSQINPDKKYNYMFLQKEKADKDTVPFETQFNFYSILDDDLLSDYGWSYNYGASNDLTGILIDKQGTEEFMEFDVENTIRYKLLTGFTNLWDRGFFHNELYGTNLITWKQVPYDFDLSFECNSLPSPYDLGIGSLPEENQQIFKDKYYSVAREIFGNPQNLFDMLTAIDAYPFRANKIKMKNFIKASFYNYALYFNSEEFAASMNKTYEPLPNAEIYEREARRLLNDPDLDILCKDSSPQNALQQWINQ